MSGPSGANKQPGFLLRLPAPLLAAVDAAAARAGLTRTEWARRVLEAAAGQEQPSAH